MAAYWRHMIKYSLLALLLISFSLRAASTSDSFQFTYQGTTLSESISGPLFQINQYIANDGGFSHPDNGGAQELAVYYGGANPLPGLINLNGTFQSTVFLGGSFITSNFIGPTLAPSSQATLVVPGYITDGGFLVGNYSDPIAILSFNFTGTETLSFTSNASGQEVLDGFSFVSTTGSDTITIPPPQSSVPEPETCILFLMGSGMILGILCFRASTDRRLPIG